MENFKGTFGDRDPYWTRSRLGMLFMDDTAVSGQFQEPDLDNLERVLRYRDPPRGMTQDRGPTCLLGGSDDTHPLSYPREISKAVVGRYKASVSLKDKWQQPPSWKLPLPSLLLVAHDERGK